MRLRLLPLLLLLSVAMVAGCATRGDPSRPIPTAFIPAPQMAQRLMVVLPGRGDDLADLRRSGVVEAIHAVWPDTDVLLAELSMPYYLQGDAPQRLHHEVVEPARARGYRELWFAGASLGGMGSLMYDRAYPDAIDGIVLLAPFLGQRAILREITTAGGIAHWDAGPPQAVTDDTWQHELWRHIQALSRDPVKARRVWLAYGESDRLRKTMPLLEPALPASQVLVRPGGHTWGVWTPAIAEVLQAAAPR